MPLAAGCSGRASPGKAKPHPLDGALLRLSKKWLAPLFRGFHSSLAPTARPGSYARKPLLRKAFCGFDAHVAKSDQSLRGYGPRPPGGFSTDEQSPIHWMGLCSVCRETRLCVRHTPGLGHVAAKGGEPCLSLYTPFGVGKDPFNEKNTPCVILSTEAWLRCPTG